jgi:4-hydroxyphenylacetate 3-monooxygenase
VYLGGERIDDVTQHPAFRNGARSVAGLYDLTSETARAHELTYVEEETGERCNLIFKRPRSSEDLAARRRVHEAWADATFGLIGRSPDHVAAFVTGMACEPSVADVHGQELGRNVVDYWRHIRDNDLYLAYAVIPPAGAKGQEPGALKAAAAGGTREAALHVVRETDRGIVVRGFKILATAAVYADEVLVGNVFPLAPGEERYAATFAVPIATPGLKLFSRKSYEQHAVSALDDPLASRFDETDAVVFLDDVEVPWERVFAYDHVDTARSIFYDTPAHSLGNAQAHVRLLAKLQLALGVIVKVTEANGIGHLPPVRDTLAGLAVRVAMLEGLVRAQEVEPERTPSGYVLQNRPTMYATMSWSCEYFPEFFLTVRELLGSSPFQLPANSSVFESAEVAAAFTSFSGGSAGDAVERYRLIKLAWDLVGSEFANRHLQYEMFYPGPRHVTRGRMAHYFDWDVCRAAAERCLALTAEPEGLTAPLSA